MVKSDQPLVTWWWVTALGTLLIPPLAVAAFAIGAVTAGRGYGSEGARMMILALVLLVVGLALRGVV